MARILFASEESLDRVQEANKLSWSWMKGGHDQMSKKKRDDFWRIIYIARIQELDAPSRDTADNCFPLNRNQNATFVF